jgi:hypothetical protein
MRGPRIALLMRPRPLRVAGESMDKDDAVN